MKSNENYSIIADEFTLFKILDVFIPVCLNILNMSIHY